MIYKHDTFDNIQSYKLIFSVYTKISIADVFSRHFQTIPKQFNYAGDANTAQS